MSALSHVRDHARSIGAGVTPRYKRRGGNYIAERDEFKGGREQGRKHYPREGCKLHIDRQNQQIEAILPYRCVQTRCSSVSCTR